MMNLDTQNTNPEVYVPLAVADPDAWRAQGCHGGGGSGLTVSPEEAAKMGATNIRRRNGSQSWESCIADWPQHYFEK